MYGDVLLYGPMVGNLDTLSPSKRYVMDPFAPSSSYRHTHNTPEEGVTILSLKRDPTSVRPWGFQVCWDEFGHGCLVESVDSLSPAEAAVRLLILFIGYRCDASLHRFLMCL